MSRYVSLVSAQTACELFNVSAEEMVELIVQGNEVEVAHGYDDIPLMPAYFCDLMPDCEIGIYYGSFGFTKSLSKTEYYEALKKLGLSDAANSVALDIPY